MTAVALVDVGALDLDPGEALDLGDLAFDRVSVIGKARTGLGADDELAALGACIDDGKGGLDAELIAVRALPLAMYSTSGACRA